MSTVDNAVMSAYFKKTNASLKKVLSAVPRSHLISYPNDDETDISTVPARHQPKTNSSKKSTLNSTKAGKVQKAVPKPPPKQPPPPKDKLAFVNSKKSQAAAASSSTELIKPMFNTEGNTKNTTFNIKSSLVDQNAKKSAAKFTGKNYKRLIDRVELQKKTIEEKEAVDGLESAMELKDSFAWKSAINKAQGIKVKDDVGLLKKALKRKDKMKRISAKNWQDRKDATEKKQSQVQEKRNKNIEAKKTSKKEKKLTKLRKKGRLLI